LLCLDHAHGTAGPVIIIHEQARLKEVNAPRARKPA
jgi:hypothetical protein